MENERKQRDKSTQSMWCLNLTEFIWWGHKVRKEAYMYYVQCIAMKYNFYMFQKAVEIVTVNLSASFLF